jgi:anti-sigma factor RsiW
MSACGTAREELAELALGTASGERRDQLLAHVATCKSCQDELAVLTRTATALWGAAQPVEPPVAFEQRAVAPLSQGEPSLTAPRAPVRRRSSKVLVVAAAIVALVGAAAGWSVHGSSRNRLADEYVEALQDLGGRALAAAPLVDAKGDGIGRAFLYEGESSWLFVEVDSAVELPVEIHVRGEAVADLKGRSFGTTLEGLVAPDLASVRLVDSDGRTVARAVDAP